MGLNKYRGKWEDVSVWSVAMIYAKIREIENFKKQTYEDYKRYCDCLDEQLEILQKELANRKMEE